MYTLLYRFQRKRFLERVIPTWLRLFELSQHLGDVSRVYGGQGRIILQPAASCSLETGRRARKGSTRRKSKRWG